MGTVFGGQPVDFLVLRDAAALPPPNMFAPMPLGMPMQMQHPGMMQVRLARMSL
jgi:hypothetical protein